MVITDTMQNLQSPSTIFSLLHLRDGRLVGGKAVMCYTYIEYVQVLYTATTSINICMIEFSHCFMLRRAFRCVLQNTEAKLLGQFDAWDLKPNLANISIGRNIPKEQIKDMQVFKRWNGLPKCRLTWECNV